MANRQRGGRPDRRTVSVSRSPADSRSPAGGRNPAVARSPSIRVQTTPGLPMLYTEPELHRWPHPVEELPVEEIPEALPETAPEPALHYIRCALSYQNQLLSDIKALLEQAVVSAAQASEQKKG